MEPDRYAARIPTIEVVKKEYLERGAGQLNTIEWCEYIVEHSRRIRDIIDDEDGEFEGEDYTLPKLKTFLNAAFYPIWIQGDDRTDYGGFGDSKEFTAYLRSTGKYRFSTIDLFMYMIKNTSLIDSAYEAYRQRVIHILQNRDTWDKQQEQAGSYRPILSTFITKHGVTEEVGEAVLYYLATKAEIRDKYKECKKNTLLALQFLNRYSAEQGIRVEDAITVLLEELL
jgi:hypothetical protein